MYPIPHHTAKNVWKSRSKNQQESEKVARDFHEKIQGKDRDPLQLRSKFPFRLVRENLPNLLVSNGTQSS
jgi:hypothetical protein